MAESEVVNVPFLTLNDVMKEEYRKKIVHRVLEFRKSPACTQSKRLNLAIRDHTSVNGFADPRNAPTAKLVGPVVKESKHSDKLMGAILAVWVESQPDLRTQVQEYYTQKSIANHRFLRSDRRVSPPLARLCNECRRRGVPKRSCGSH